MTTPLRLLYRGPLASCNYDCPYCPFAKRRDTLDQLRLDRECLGRFVDWCARNPYGHQLSVLFTPWGEGLTRRWYATAIAQLAQLSHVDRVAIQTNLAARLDWLAAVSPSDRARVALWATYHPGQVAMQRFLSRCSTLDDLGVRYSVGVVGLPEHLAAARALREHLPATVYLWVNAAEGHSYGPDERDVWTQLDPLFGYSVTAHASAGHECRAGESVLSVQGDGTVRRCHFVPTPLGNLYDGSYLTALRPRPCTNAVCDCHIGYVHLKRLPLYEVFRGGVLERIPAQWGVPAAFTSGAVAGTAAR
jgi:MoaA/NifB/PqqE/SkfB family radical SAM enzyme